MILLSWTVLNSIRLHMSHVLGASAGLDEAWVKDVFVPTVQKVHSSVSANISQIK